MTLHWILSWDLENIRPSVYQAIATYFKISEGGLFAISLKQNVRLRTFYSNYTSIFIRTRL